MRHDEREPLSRKRRRESPARTSATSAAKGQASHPWMVVFAAAFGLRLLYVLSIHNAYFFQQLQTEALHYHQWASLILGGRAPLPPFEQSPGYPYAVAAVYALCGHSVTAVAVVQALLDAATCMLLAVLGGRWFGARAGLIAGGLAAVYGPLIYFAGQMLPSTLFVFTAVAALAAGAFGAVTAAGCLWAAALLVRSEIVLAIPFVLFDVWSRGGRGALVRIAAPVVLSVALMVGFNAAGSGRFVLFTTSGGVNLWLGNNPHADGVNPFIYGPLESVTEEVRAQATTGVEADRIFRRHAVTFIRDSPGDALRLLWKKLLWTLSDRELPNTDDIEWVTAHSWLFWRPVFPLSFGMLLPLACAGAVVVGRQWRQCASLAGLFITGLVTGVVFFTNARFRLILVPPVSLLAAVALDRLPGMLAAWPRRRGRLIGAGAALTTGAVLAWGDFYGVRAYRIPQISVNTGAMEREAGEFDAAVQHLRAGLAGDPDDAIAWVHLALALEQKGDVESARQAYRDAQARLPNDPEVQQMAARFRERHP
ncbi:MAG TPA: tetratricopeptide repeat protein [Candidatus Margulisiibacteriota bacterium]|nr:tetratricopeptide repeat protein [Candidatus Margulisiibacteriota bacterium]